MRMLLAVSAIVFAAVPAGAASAHQTARLGEIVRFGGLAVRPIAVLEDSRCPKYVTCVWRGRLRVSVQVGQRRVTLDDGAPLSVRGGHLTLVRATPLSGRGETIPPAAYRFTLRFER